MMSDTPSSLAAEADDSDLTTMDDEVPISRHFSSLFSTIALGEERSEKLTQAQELQACLSQPDGYIEFSSTQASEAQLPPLEWNRHFRKAYTILSWVKPEVSNTPIPPSTTPHHFKQVLYRFSTSDKDSKGAGLCVQVGDWMMDEENGDLLKTTVTAFLLPTQSQQTAMTHASLLQIPLILQKDKWQLLGISHVYPYLKPSTLTISVNGHVVGVGELAYPVVENNIVMEYCSLFMNIANGGVIAMRKAKNSDANDDDDKIPASQLNTTAKQVQKFPFSWQVATIALYPDPVSPEFLAIIADAGVQHSLQHEGRIVCPLPPVANSTKGSALDSHGGPSVGIPLSVHPLALELQHEISRVVLYVSATNAQVLKTRIVCPFVLHGGHYESTPKVGLLQPSIPLVVEAAIHFIGSKVRHQLSTYLLTSTCPQHLLVEEASHSLSVIWSEQAFLASIVLPFFLALPPNIPELQPSLQISCLKQLYHLYCKQGEWASTLINLLVSALQHQGGRLQEEVLQCGIVPILATTLRRSLVRAQQLKLWDYETFQEFTSSLNGTELPIHSATSPKRIPVEIAKACASLVQVACGNDTTNNSNTIRRESDLSMICVFGLALDFDLWGVDVASATLVIGEVAKAFGGMSDMNRGTILRNQIPVQSLLDQIRIRFNVLTRDAEELANSLSSILTSMLLSSLSNKRNIAQAEHDVSACIGALSDCPLGTVGAHVILASFGNLLEWCDIVPSEQDLQVNDDDKLQVATRLGRNLVMAQYHDVVAPMLLSRTVFCGERVLAQSDAPHLWQYHWRLSLLLFVWVSSISGPEGDVASKSTGSLLFASGLAGSLRGCMVSNKDLDGHLLSSLLLPPPALALTVSANRNHDSWTYTDLLSDRLKVMMPLLPGLVVSLISHPADVTMDTLIAADSMEVLTELITSVTTSFHRAFGMTLPRTESAAIVKAARDYAPNLLMVAMLLESHIRLRISSTDSDDAVVILKCRQPKGDDDEWVEVPTDNDETVLYGSPAKKSEVKSETEALVKELIKCQRMVLNALTDLITSAMRHGGAEGSMLVWRSVVATLSDSVFYGAVSTLPSEGSSDDGVASSSGEDDKKRGDTLSPLEASDNDKDDALAQNMLCRLAAVVLTKSQRRSHAWELWSQVKSASVSRLCNLIEEKELLQKPLGENGSCQNCYSRDQVLLLCSLLDVMAYGREVTGWCQLVLPTPPAIEGEESADDEDIAAGVSPAMSSPKPKKRGLRGAFVPPESPSASSSSLLPVLQPALRVVLGCLGSVSSDVEILIPSEESPGNSSSNDTKGITTKEESLFLHMSSELKHTLTAAIVGLSFPNARDVALNSLASLRRASINYRNTNDKLGVESCALLFVLIVEEIRVRYEGERRLREKALFDAYNDDGETSGRKFEADASAEVERLILGGDLIPKSTKVEKTESIEEIHFDADASDDTEQKETATQSKPKVEGEDFVLFHGAFKNNDGRQEKGSFHRKEGNTMGYAHYEGLGSTLEECKMLLATSSDAKKTNDQSTEAIIRLLTPYLDTWDENAARDAADSELVGLFDAGLTMTGSDLSGGKAPSETSDSLTLSAQLPIFGSETAADAMSTFIEISSGEKSRLNEVISTFMPSHRQSCIAYAERFCWARYMEITHDGTDFSMENLLERCVADGNRDIRSRLISMPCKPQFPRRIPSYLDNTATVNDSEGSSRVMDRTDSDVNDETDILNRSSVTKALIAAGNIEIKDITKKDVSQDEIPDMWEGDSDGPLVDDEGEALMLDEGGIGFAEDEDSSEQGGIDNSERPGESAGVDESEGEESPEGDSDLKGRAVDKAHLSSFHHHIASTRFSDPPDNSSSVLSLLHSATPGVIEEHYEHCVHVKTEGNRKCTLLLSSTHLILEYDPDSEGWFDGEMLAVQEETERQRMIEEAGGGKDNLSGEEKKDDEMEQQLKDLQRESAHLRPKSIRWNLSELSHVYLRRYRLRDSALEMFFLPSGGSSFGGFGLYSPGTSLFLDFGPGREGNISRDDAAHSIMRRAPPQAITQWPDRSPQFLHDQLSRLTMGWVDGRITNFDYLLHLNMLAGRSYNDLCQYPVMPWVLSNYTSEEIPDLTDKANFRDLSKPMGALNPERLEEFIERFESFSDPTIPPFMYGSHYSTSAGVVLHFLVRMHPFAGLHRQLQSGHFDVADRLFSSVPRTWEMCTGSSAAEVKELTPEWYCNPTFLKNTNNFKLGVSQEGELLGDVTLPPWADGSPEKFVEVMRNAMESDICSEMLPDWIDLIFGRKQQGPEAIKANNVFFYLTYYGSVDVASIEDESLRTATELQIAHFGQCPMQLFSRPHVRRVQRMRHYRKLTFYQMLSAYTQGAGRGSNEKGEASSDDDALVESRHVLKTDGSQRVFGEPIVLPFFSAPLSHWVHLEAPPPGPHAALIALRLAGTDRVLAIDAQGIFHSFRWAWKAELSPDDDGRPFSPANAPGTLDEGVFIAQRELPRFRTLPRVPHVPPKRPGEESAKVPAVAISKTLFASRSVLLVLSDGDGRGALSMQLVDPAQGSVKGEAMVPAVHSSRISCIAMDPIGTAAGHGGVGGELAIVGSADGGASLWRFMSSHYLPLRPRVRMRGHAGAKVQAVALSSAIHVCASVSANRCCIFSVGNGNMIRSFAPPQDTLELPDSVKSKTVFADTPALALSVQGFIVTVCHTTVLSDDAPTLHRDIITLHLFSLEGVSLGSKALESWRGIPHKITCTPDGTAITVCSGRGVTIHRLSAITPLEFIDEWHITEADELDENTPAAWDVDFGPSLLRPVVAAAACSGGVLRLHALPGITPWSERHKKSTMGTAVGQALSKPAQRIKSAMGKSFGIGQKFVGVGKDIGKEVTSDVKERGVGGFLASTLFKKK